MDSPDSQGRDEDKSLNAFDGEGITGRDGHYPENVARRRSQLDSDTAPTLITARLFRPNRQTATR